MTEIPINFGETMAGNSNRQIADPAGIGNNEIDDVSASPEVMTSLQMFQQQRLEISELYLIKRVSKVLHDILKSTLNYLISNKGYFIQND